MVPAIKVWEMDYSFIIKNYLNPVLWDKVWTLFAYKDFVITIQINSIDTMDKEIIFLIKFKDYSNNDVYRNSRTETISYVLNTDIDFLLKKINGSIFRMINIYERMTVITNLASYAIVEEYEEQEEARLKRFATDFLDENDVTNEEIRNVYIDNYISNNSQADDYGYKFRNANEYHHLTDLYLVFTKSTQDDENYQMVLNHLKNDEREKVIKEINELQMLIESDTYEEEMQSQLESI